MSATGLQLIADQARYDHGSFKDELPENAGIAMEST